jgi:hypothetical protein
MTRYLDPDPGFDRRIADWLEVDPGHAPVQVLETVLAAFPSIPQRTRRLPRRAPTMVRFAYVAAAAVAVVAVVAIAVGGLLEAPRPSGGPAVPATASPGPSVSPSVRSPAPSTPAATARPTVSAMWTATGDMVEIRFGASATLLPNGDVLVAGGSPRFNRGGITRATAELYDPSTGRWTLTGSMREARQDHSAVLLANGKVLVLGGNASDGGPARLLSSAELYDPSTGTWTDTGRLLSARTNATATLLADGRVLVAGGVSSSADRPERSAEVYDPATGTWAKTSAMRVARNGHTATLLPDGHVLVTGGQCCSDPAVASSELYDPISGTWTATGALDSARRNHAAVLLSNGKVLVYGGDDGNSASPAITTAELYDPATGMWVATGSPGSPGNTLEGQAVRLSDGRVAAIGLGAHELYAPTSGSWSAIVGGPDIGGPIVHTATLLVDGRILVTYEPASVLFDPNGTP